MLDRLRTLAGRRGERAQGRCAALQRAVSLLCSAAAATVTVPSARRWVAIAADLADFCVVTSDNPRTEEPKAIIDDILEGMKDSDTPMQVIVDRPEAIHWALAHAQKDDIIVLMGKGHETYQEVNHVKHHMDEREIVADYFA